MNAISASPADSTDSQGAPRRFMVWDLPVRLFHWLMVACFAGAWVTAETERWRLVHVTLGYTMLGLVIFRLVWGLVGTRHARFSDFVKGPRAVAAYFRSLLRGKPTHHAGHNPAGAIAIVFMLGLVLVVTAAGWATFNDLGGGWTEDLHEGAANALLAVVIAHVVGVVIASWMHRENLPAAMITGRKPGDPAQSIPGTRRLVGALMVVAVIGFWVQQWRDAPNPGLQASASANARSEKHGKHDRDHD